MRGKKKPYWGGLLSLVVGLAVVRVWPGAPAEAQAGELSLGGGGGWFLFTSIAENPGGDDIV